MRLINKVNLLKIFLRKIFYSNKEFFISQKKQKIIFLKKVDKDIERQDMLYSKLLSNYIKIYANQLQTPLPRCPHA